MKKLVLILVAGVALLGGAAVSSAQDRERAHGAPYAQTEGVGRGESARNVDGDRDHRRRLVVVVVGVPIYVVPAYVSYVTAPPMEQYRTIDGFFYYCADPAGYYPDVQDCATGWRLVP